MLFVCSTFRFFFMNINIPAADSYLVAVQYNIWIENWLLLLFLQDLTLKHGWRTGAIIPELRKEIKIMNTEEYIHMVSWSQALTGLIEQMQV